MQHVYGPGRDQGWARSTLRAQVDSLRFHARTLEWAPYGTIARKSKAHATPES